ncbi:MAG: hypothetical protein HY754_00655 [Nitrospirae bacterium]|nr:hypothetical protein [Nitrospirota bacterium]
MKILRVLNNEDGFFKFILVIATIAFLMYAGVQFGMPYYRYSAFKNDAIELARISVGELEKTKGQIYEKAQEHKLPLKEKDIEVISSGKVVRVKASWSETVDILGIYETTLDFDVDIEG